MFSIDEPFKNHVALEIITCVTYTETQLIGLSKGAHAAK